MSARARRQLRHRRARMAARFRDHLMQTPAELERFTAHLETLDLEQLRKLEGELEHTIETKGQPTSHEAPESP